MLGVGSNRLCAKDSAHTGADTGRRGSERGPDERSDGKQNNNGGDDGNQNGSAGPQRKGDKMNWADFFEQMAIQSGIQAIFQALKSPTAQAKWLPILLHVADTIYIAAGLTPPAHS